MVKISNIVILLTPHHKKAMAHLFPELFVDQKTLVLHTQIIDVSEFRCNSYELTDYNFSRRRLFASPLTFIKPFRNNIKQINSEIRALLKEYHFKDGSKLYLGSDKDIFTQIFLSRLKTILSTVIAVDEGLGFYVKHSAKDNFIKVLYALITPILFGQRLYYIKRMGTLAAIDTVYIRHKKLLPKLNPGVQYVSFRLKSDQNPRNIKNGAVLFFSYPEQDFMLDPKEKIRLHTQVAQHLEKSQRHLIIKPHPRENIEFLKENLKGQPNVTILQARLLGEELDYFNYELIINVFSSVILDILDNNYPKSKLLTLGYHKTPPMKFDKELKYIPLSVFNVAKDLNLES